MNSKNKGSYQRERRKRGRKKHRTSTSYQSARIKKLKDLPPHVLKSMAEFLDSQLQAIQCPQEDLEFEEKLALALLGVIKSVQYVTAPAWLWEDK